VSAVPAATALPLASTPVLNNPPIDPLWCWRKTHRAGAVVSSTALSLAGAENVAQMIGQRRAHRQRAASRRLGERRGVIPRRDVRCRQRMPSAVSAVRDVQGVAPHRAGRQPMRTASVVAEPCSALLMKPSLFGPCDRHRHRRAVVSSTALHWSRAERCPDDRSASRSPSACRLPRLGERRVVIPRR